MDKISYRKQKSISHNCYLNLYYFKCKYFYSNCNYSQEELNKN